MAESMRNVLFIPAFDDSSVTTQVMAQISEKIICFE
jgi:hypothetical protein